MPAVALEVDARALARLERAVGAASIELDDLYSPALLDSVEIVEVDPGSMGELGGTAGGKYAVAVVDSGIDSDHRFLRDKVIDEACFSTTGHCAGGATSAYGPGTGAPCEFAEGCWHGRTWPVLPPATTRT